MHPSLGLCDSGMRRYMQNKRGMRNEVYRTTRTLTRAHETHRPRYMSLSPFRNTCLARVFGMSFGSDF